MRHLPHSPTEELIVSHFPSVYSLTLLQFVLSMSSMGSKTMEKEINREINQKRKWGNVEPRKRIFLFLPACVFLKRSLSTYFFLCSNSVKWSSLTCFCAAILDVFRQCSKFYKVTMGKVDKRRI